MDETNTSENTSPELGKREPEKESKYVNFKFKKPNRVLVIVTLLVILALVAIYFAKGILIAATVDGSPISRLSVIKELEKQGGKQALEGMIQEKLITTELDKQNVHVTPEEVDAEIDTIKEQIESQGGTLEQMLSLQGVSIEDVRSQITLQKRLEKLLENKTAVSADEVKAYIEDNQITPPDGITAEELSEQVGEQLRGQKLQEEAQKWISNLKETANITYHIEY